MQKNSVVGLVGVGPYCHFTHLPNLLSLGYMPRLIVELESRQQGVTNLIAGLGIKNIETVFIEDQKKDLTTLSPIDADKIQKAMANSKVNKIILSTEPKAHLAYLKFFSTEGCDIFCEKPLTVSTGATVDISEAKKIWSDYLEVLNLVEKKKIRLDVNVKRRVFKPFLFVKEFLNDLVQRFEMPPTSIEISASDGMWNMPNEILERENHPYKYGYGKLFHTGFHYVDLLTELAVRPREILGQKFDSLQVTARSLRPKDQIQQIQSKHYDQFFGKDSSAMPKSDFQKETNQFGELDLFSILDFQFDTGGTLLTSLNLLSTSFSRRSWDKLPYDTYRSNGRVRHERWNIHVGPLANIQFQEYGSLKYKGDEVSSPYPISELILFRNKALTGGSVFERITDFSFYPGIIQGKEEFKLLSLFLNNEPSESSIDSLAESIYVHSALAEELAKDFQREKIRYQFLKK